MTTEIIWKWNSTQQISFPNLNPRWDTKEWLNTAKGTLQSNVNHFNIAYPTLQHTLTGQRDG